MSYSFSVTTQPGDDVQEAVEQAADHYRQQYQPEEHAGESIATAAGAVLAVLQSGALGDPDEYGFNVNVNGHANPEHKPAEGWSNDHLTISISQL